MKNKILKNRVIDPKTHNLIGYNICLEEPLIYKYNKRTYDDIYMDLLININGDTYKIECREPSDLRLNKLSIDKETLNINDNKIKIVKTFSSYKNVCICNYCKANLEEYKKHTQNIELIDYYFGYKSNYLVFDFVEKLTTTNKKILIKSDTEISKKHNLPIANFNFKEFDLHLLFDETIIDNTQDTFNYVYLLQKFDINENKYIYKFGKTSRDFQKRLKEHGREAKILMVLDVENCSFCETQVLNSLKSDPNIKHCKNIGNEYFSCDNKQYIIKKITKILS